MHSLFSHIRGRATSQPITIPSHQEISSDVPPTPALTHGVDPNAETSPAARYALGGKILENPSAYLDMPDDPGAPTYSLSPSTRRHSWGHRNVQRTKFISESVAEVDEPHGAGPFQSVSIDRPLQLAATGNWSTFGRQRVRNSQVVPEFPDHRSVKDTTRRISSSPSLKRNTSNNNFRGPNSTGSSHSVATFGNASRSSLAPHDIPAQMSNHGHTLTIPDSNFTSNLSINSKPSPTDTEASRWRPRTPNRPRSNTSPTTRPTAYLTTPILRELGFDSPGTFGHPTPENRSRSTFTFTQPSPLPPMPSLNHPALSSRLEDKGATNTTSGFPEQFNAFPIRSSRIPYNIGDDFFASLSMSFGRSLRHSASLPFPSSSDEQPAQRSRARTISDKAPLRRRNSASWSAQQATEGVTSSSNTEWPAEVSREILRLSLGEGLDPLSGVPGPGSQTLKDKAATRVDNVAQFPDQAPISRSFSPSSPSPRRRSPIPQGGDHIPPSLRPPHSLRPASYHDPRMSAKSSNDAHVVQDGASSPDNATSRLDAPVGPNITQGRTLSQFFLTPTIKPTPARTTRSITLDPSTPTPAPRNLSDKSKGKRKAEDIETTPPEQKKDSQRATFAVPESNRSQKLSGSSHAPSSYHRKRARLSASSPFSTPVQSRPVSIQGQATSLQSTPEVVKSGSWSGQTSARILGTPRAPSRATSSRAASSRSIHPHKTSHTHHSRHQSMSQVSIPISALVSPHAPSIVPSGKFHMRDPRRPPKKLAQTPWTLQFRSEDEPGSPVHAWCFFFGFVLFPVWWIAALFLRTPGTRVVGDEKGMSLDDPQIEHDAKAWRFRCRIMSVTSLFTYIPFIILVVIFTRR